MALGFIPEWIPLLDAIQHIQRVAGCSCKAACDELLIALCGGGVLSRVRGQAVRRGPGIAPEQWYGATVFCDGSVTFADNPRFPRLRPSPLDLGPLRYQIEVRRGDVLKWWPPVGKPPESERVTEQSIADAAPRGAKRAVNSKQTMEAAVREYIAATYPNGIPAGKTDKMIAADYTSTTGAPMSERTVRRARTVKG